MILPCIITYNNIQYTCVWDMCVALSILGLPRALKLQVNIPSNRDQVHINPSKTWQKTLWKTECLMFLYVFYSSTPGFQLAKISTSRAFVDSQPIATGRSGWPGLPFPLARRRVAWAPPMANCDIIWVPKKNYSKTAPSLLHIWSVISIFHHMSGCFLFPITIPIVPLEMSNSSPKM